MPASHFVSNPVFTGPGDGEAAGTPSTTLAELLREIEEARVRLATAQRERLGNVVKAPPAPPNSRDAAEIHQQQIQFLALTAHELRNPLVPIRTVATLLTKCRAEDLPRLQAILERQVVHLTRLVDDLLDVSRMRSGKLRVQRERMDLVATLHAAIDACRPAMQERDQRFSLQLPEAELPMHGDAVRLSQVMTNLLDNASKYTPRGGEIALSAAIVDSVLVLTVTDSGIGIAPEALPAVFEPFVQEPRAVGFHGTGLGLGLAVVAELVQAHDGTVGAHSRGVGCGSRFIVTLPMLAVT